MTGRIFVLVAVVCSPVVALASPIFFSTRSDFNDAVTPTHVQGFEDPFEEGPSVSFDGFSVSERSNFANITARTDYVSAGDRALGFTWNGSTQFVFEFSPPVNAFAVDILDFGTCCDATSLDALSGSGEIDGVAAVGGDLPRGNNQFFGFTSNDPIATLSFSSQTLSDNDLIVFDEVAIRAVPEPTGLNLLMLLLVLCVCKKTAIDMSTKLGRA